MSDLTWTNEQRKLSDLVPWEHNPKRMTKKQADGLRQSIEHFGFAVPFLVSPTGDIYDGHQRQTLMGAIKDYGPNATVDVRVSSRPLTDDERRELVVRLRQNQASWDFEGLANLYEREELLEWGFEPEELGLFGDDGADDEPYSRKIQSPVYEPSGDKPPVKDLFDNAKTLALIAAIQAAEGLTDEERQFLTIAAQRHTVLHFNRIADFYAHAPASTQALMEDSALVIIDFNRAIELGYVKLSEEIAKLYGEDYPDA